MRWMMIVLLASVAALLLAVAGVARHIWLQRARLQSNPDAGPVRKRPSDKAIDPMDEIDREIEI
jgi:hypothetical protein